MPIVEKIARELGKASKGTELLAQRFIKLNISLELASIDMILASPEGIHAVLREEYCACIHTDLWKVLYRFRHNILSSFEEHKNIINIDI